MKNEKMSRCLITVGKPDAHKELHFGHLSGGLIYADIYSRFLKREIGEDNVLFLSGTECYGSAVQTAYLKAQNTEENIEKYVENMHLKQAEMLKRFQIYPDSYFCDSMDKELNEIHTDICQRFIDSLFKNGDLQKKDERILTEDGRFLNYREISSKNQGSAQYKSSYADYNEQITELFITRTGKEPTEKHTENYFIQFPKREEGLKLLFEADAPEYLDYIARSLSGKEGDNTNCFRITSDSDWGISVNIDGYQKRLWVWIDSILAPISFTVKKCKDYESGLKWWCDEGSVVLHYIAEDNLKFYSALESYLISSWNDTYGEKINLPKLKLTAMRSVKSSRGFPTGDDLLSYYTAEQIRYSVAAMGNRSATFEPKRYTLYNSEPDNVTMRCDSTIGKIERLIAKAKRLLDYSGDVTPDESTVQAGSCIFGKYVEEMHAQRTYRVIDLIEENLKRTANCGKNAVYFAKLFLYMLYPVLPEYSLKSYRYLFGNDGILTKNTF